MVQHRMFYIYCSLGGKHDVSYVPAASMLKSVCAVLLGGYVPVYTVESY